MRASVPFHRPLKKAALVDLANVIRAVRFLLFVVWYDC
jgi:hypothetical protein